MKRFAAFFGLVGLGGGWALVSPASLDSPTFDLVSVQDSGTYFVYSYSMSNPATSTEAIGPFVLSISASSGTPSPLAATGNFYDYSNLTHAPGSAAPRAEVGPMSPTGWTALLQRTATVRWYPTVAGLQHLDSIAPDSMITDFGLRSSYLPGISSVLAEPTWQACCSVMDPLTQQNPIPDTFAVSASAVAPKYMPSEVELDLLQSQLTAICGSLMWLDNSSLCTELGDLLDEAEADETNGSHYGAASVLGHLSSRVSTEQAEFESSGYWLFSLNVEQARENLLATAAASADQWHFVDTWDGPLTNGRALDSIAPTQNYVSGSIDTRDEETFRWVEPVSDSVAFADGLWAVQLHFFDMTENRGPLTLEDVSVSRYANGGSLLESKDIQSGVVTSLLEGETRVSLSANLSGWSDGNDDDYFVVTFTLVNDNNGNGSESYKIATGTDNSSWGGSWVSKPK